MAPWGVRVKYDQEASKQLLHPDPQAEVIEPNVSADAKEVSSAAEGGGVARTDVSSGDVPHVDTPRTIRPKIESVRPSFPHSVTSDDPRLAEIELALAASDWDHVAGALGPADAAARLPPNLGVILAVALKEKERGEVSPIDLTELAIRCCAKLFGVDPASPIALVLAKRLLRKNPVAWQKKPAPPPRTSFLIIAIGLFVGCTIGWAVSFGYIRFHFP